MPSVWEIAEIDSFESMDKCIKNFEEQAQKTGVSSLGVSNLEVLNHVLASEILAMTLD